MRTSRAFVFSLDSFVAFVLTVAALYSLLFFATVPSAYYSSLMQANYLAKDTLITLATTTLAEEDAEFDCEEGQTYLSCIISNLKAGEYGPARIYIGSDIIENSPQEQQLLSLVPPQFGYKIEIMEFEGDDEIDFEEGNWDILYDTKDDPDSANKKEYNKLKAAAHALYFGYEEGSIDTENDLHYVSCGGEYTICNWPEPFIYNESYIENMDVIGEVYSSVVRLTVYT